MKYRHHRHNRHRLQNEHTMGRRVCTGPMALTDLRDSLFDRRPERLPQEPQSPSESPSGEPTALCSLQLKVS